MSLEGLGLFSGALSQRPSLRLSFCFAWQTTRSGAGGWMLHARCGMLGTGGPGRGSESAEGAGLGSLRGRGRSGPPCPMFLPASLRLLALRRAQRLRGVRGADHTLEVVYVELWMLQALFGE